MTVVITGEGVTDYGWKDFGSNVWHEGSAAVLLKRVVSEYTKEDVELAFVDKNELKKENRPKKFQRHITNLEGRGIPCFFFLNLVKEKYKETKVLPVFYTDADKERKIDRKTESGCKKLLEERYNQIENAVLNAGYDCIPMVPVKMIENWMMGDGKAIQKVFGEIPKGLPAKPELVWGTEDDPNSDYPKNLLDRLFKSVNNGIEVKMQREVFAEIAEKIDLKTERKTCYISFDSFCRKIEKYFEGSNHKMTE